MNRGISAGREDSQEKVPNPFLSLSSGAIFSGEKDGRGDRWKSPLIPIATFHVVSSENSAEY